MHGTGRKKAFMKIASLVVALCVASVALFPLQDTANVYAAETATPPAVTTPGGVTEDPAADEADKKAAPDPKKMKPELVTNANIKPTYARLMKDIKALKKRYPGLVDYEYIGESAAGVKIPLVTLGTGEKKALITASIHGREFVTTSFVMRSIDTYAYAWAKNKKIDGQNVRQKLKDVTFYFVPMYNPDGVAIAEGKANAKQKALAVKAVGKSHYNKTRKLWKSNARGVNLNRNFPLYWDDQSHSKKPNYIGYRGKSAGSEPETQALLSLCAENDFTFVINCHTRGAVLYWRDWYAMTVPGADALTSKIGAITGYTRESTGKKDAGGTFEKWFRYNYNRPGIVIEFTRWTQNYQTANKNFDNAVNWSSTKALWLKLTPHMKFSNTYKLYYNANGGKVALKQSAVTRYKDVTRGKAVGKLSAAARKGYVFKGWYTEKKGGEHVTSKTKYDLTRSLVVYARWEKK